MKVSLLFQFTDEDNPDKGEHTLKEEKGRRGASFNTEGQTHKNKQTNGSRVLQLTVKRQNEIGLCLAKPEGES